MFIPRCFVASRCWPLGRSLRGSIGRYRFFGRILDGLLSCLRRGGGVSPKVISLITRQMFCRTLKIAETGTAIEYISIRCVPQRTFSTALNGAHFHRIGWQHALPKITRHRVEDAWWHSPHFCCHFKSRLQRTDLTSFISDAVIAHNSHGSSAALHGRLPGNVHGRGFAIVQTPYRSTHYRTTLPPKTRQD